MHTAWMILDLKIGGKKVIQGFKKIQLENT
jgi:hypothetical protein